MLLMMAETLHLSRVARAFPTSHFWSFLAYHQTHVDWAGCSLHDTIQPGFSFLVGAALPYSIAARLAKGSSFRRMFFHALWRSLILIALGIFLRSLHRPQTYFTFEDTLTQIGLGYPLLFLLAFLRPRWQWISVAVILVGYWLAWALYPAGPVFDHYTGFAAHWNQASNLGVAFDRWFLNLFPRAQPFTANSGGYATISFIPTLGTMLLGLAAGRWMMAASPRVPFRRLIGAGLIGIASGLLLHATGICPVVKRIWTPSWTLFSGGICFLFLAAFSWCAPRMSRWSFILSVVGINSMAA
jgi:predicted acyltransferase